MYLRYGKITLEPRIWLTVRGIMTSRKKHIGIKYHWFRSMIGPQIEILRIDTKEQRTDIFTKGLMRYNFEQIRKQVMGW